MIKRWQQENETRRKRSVITQSALLFKLQQHKYNICNTYNMAAFRCDKCGFASFKTEQSFQGHLLTKKHMMNHENVRKDLFQCKTCNKWYCGRSGISHHNKTCSFKKLNHNPIISEQVIGGTSVKEIINESKLQQPKGEQSKLDIDILYEKERDVQNALIKTMQQQIDEQKKDQKKMKDIIAAIEHHYKKSTSQCLTQLQPHKSRDKRKKINKDMRQHVVNKQENACGMCKLTLTPYFEIDHIIGLQFGGTDDEANLMALCRECHAKKSITENQCRPQIKDAIQTILREKLGVDQRV